MHRDFLVEAYITIGIRLQYDDTMMHSITKEEIKITICICFDCDTTMIQLRRKIDMFIFACFELEAGARECRSHIVVESQL